VLLTWKNPTDLDFKQVRIVRNYLFYPADQSDGFIVYQGDGTLFIDRDALGDSTTKFYSVFTYDEKGNISSGAIIAIRADGVVILNPLMTQEGGTATDTSAGFDDSASTERDTHEGTGLTFDHIEFLQNNDHIYGKKIDIEIPLTVRIAYGKLPEHLKTITVSFTHPNDTEASFSFLLRINKDKTYYEATIAPLRIVGLYPVSVFVFDYTTKKLIALTGSLYAERITTFAHTVTGVKKFVQQLEVVKDRALAPAFAWWWALLAVVGYRIFKILLR
jgi:hypothetical protein